MLVTYNNYRSMADDDSAKITQFPMTADNMRRIVREIAADTNRIIILKHALERAGKRGFSRRQIERCCQAGSVVEGPFENKFGNWQANFYRHAAGEEMTCTVAVDLRDNVLIITVF